jgi:hypothetical protein
MNIAFYINGGYEPILSSLAKELNEYNIIAFCQNNLSYRSAQKKPIYKAAKYLYSDFNKRFDNFLVNEEKEYLINLYVALSADKSHFKMHSASYQEKVSKIMYSIFEEWLNELKPDFVFFPIIESIDAMILYQLCFSLKIKTICYGHGRHINRSFFTESYTESLPYYYKYISNNQDNTILAASFLNDFKINKKTLIYSDFYSDTSNTDFNIKLENLFIRFVRNIILTFTIEKHNQTLSLKVKFLVFIERILVPLEKKIYRLVEIFYIKPVKNLPYKFDLFPLHFSPESSINTPSPYFIDQIRAIEHIKFFENTNNSILLIKEHPSMYMRRPISFYKKIKKMPYVRFVPMDTKISNLIEKSDRVYSITGTAAMEAFFLGIDWKLIGKNFLSDWLEDNMSNINNPTSFINDVIKVSSDFILFSPTSKNKKLNNALFSKTNILKMANHFRSHINNTLKFRK